MEKKQKKGKKKLVLKTPKPKPDLALEEHIARLIEEAENKKSIKQSIDSVVKTTKPKKTKSEKRPKEENKRKKSEESPYGRRRLDTEYRGLEDANVYNQVIINPFVGFVYKSNVKENRESYTHLMRSEIAEKTPDKLGERNLASSETMDEYAQKFSLNLLIGTSMNIISVEEKELVFFNLYDRSQQQIYLAKIAILGFGYQRMHAPMADAGNKAA